MSKIRIDDITYSWLSRDEKDLTKFANVTNIRITPIQSIFSMVTGLMNLTVTFLSPVEVSTTMSCQSRSLLRINSLPTGSNNPSHFLTYL